LAETKPSTPKQVRISKFRRQPKAVADRKLTARSFQIVATIARYRFLPTSLAVRLVDGNEDVTSRHLQQLFHKGLINRFAFPKTGGSNEFNYYIDDTKALTLLVEQGLAAKSELDWEQVRSNKERKYCEISESTADAAGRMLFLQHELMISRFHYMLEMACTTSKGVVELARWSQGAELHNSVTDSATGHLLPHRPDAFFTLRFPQAAEGANRSNFFYEADRSRTSLPKMMAKLRGHYEFVSQKKHQHKYGINRIRAVLVETLDTQWAEALRHASAHICSAPLFWFTASEIFMAQTNATGAHPIFLRMPGVVFKKVWALTGKDGLHALD
jgi:hypothetical protein